VAEKKNSGKSKIRSQVRKINVDSQNEKRESECSKIRETLSKTQI